MAKKEKSINPADAHRRAQHKKEVKKNKLERRKAREESLLKRDPARVNLDIVKYTRLDGEGRLDAAGKEKLLKLTAAKQKIEEARKSNSGNGSLPVAPSIPTKKLKDPTNSLYYDPVLNPFGIPPPGEPYRDKEGNLNVEFEGTEDKVTKENQEYTLSGLSDISSSAESEPDETDQTGGIELPNLPVETEQLSSEVPPTSKPTPLTEVNSTEKDKDNLPPLPAGDVPEFALSQLPGLDFLPSLPQGLPPRHALIYPRPDHFPADGAHHTRPPFFPPDFSQPPPQFTPNGPFPPGGFPHLDSNFVSPPPPPPHFPITSYPTIPYPQPHYLYPPPGPPNFFPPPPPPGGPPGRPPPHFNNFPPPPPGGPPGRPPLHFGNYPPPPPPGGPPPHFGNYPPPPPPGGPPMNFMHRPPLNQGGIPPPYFPSSRPPPFHPSDTPQGVPRPPPQSRPHFEPHPSIKRPAPTPPAPSSSNGSHPNQSSSTPIPSNLKEVNNGSVMISAEPELRDLKKELTTLVPSALLRKKAKEAKALPTKPSHSTSSSSAPGIGKNLVSTTSTPGVSIRLFRPKINAAPDLDDDDGPAAPPSRVPTFLPATTSTAPPPVTTPQPPPSSSPSLPPPATKPTMQASDDYDTFMKEMEGLI